LLFPCFELLELGGGRVVNEDDVYDHFMRMNIDCCLN